MSDEKLRNYPVPSTIIDTNYTDTKLPDIFKAEVPSDSFYDFINKPEDNSAEFADLINGLSGSGSNVLVTANPDDTLTPDKFDKIVEVVANKTYSSLGIQAELLNPVPNRNGAIFNTTAMNNKSYTTMNTEDADALVTEMNLLKEKNDNYLDLIQKQAEALKEKDKMIAKLSDALQKSLERELNTMSGENTYDEKGEIIFKEINPPPKPQIDNLMQMYGL